jgi:hypothetical protein
LDLALAWRVGSPPGDDTILFAGLFDEQGLRWAQTDEQPLGSGYSVKVWPEGTTIRTPLRVWVPTGTPPGHYQLEVGWYRFVDGQPVWLPWTSGERLSLGQVIVEAPEDWGTVPTPKVALPAGVTMGKGVQLLGIDAQVLVGQPGDALPVDLFWWALDGPPEPGPAVLQLTNDAGEVLAETSSAPAGGLLPFTELRDGQVVRYPRSLVLPVGLPAGVYNLSLGRRGPDGTWLPVRRGLIPLGATYPLATIRVKGRSLDTTAPAVQHPVDVRFGDGVRLVGYDLDSSQSDLQVTLYWQALAPMTTRYKVFVHLVGDGGPSDIRAQADIYPHLPTTGWVPGEYLTDHVTLDLPTSLPAGPYTLLLGLYDEAAGTRLPASGASGEPLGDSSALETMQFGE